MKNYKGLILYVGSATPDLHIILSTAREKLPELKIIETNKLEAGSAILGEDDKTLDFKAYQPNIVPMDLSCEISEMTLEMYEKPKNRHERRKGKSKKVRSLDENEDKYSKIFKRK